MELSIRTNSIEVTDELRELVAKRLQFALDSFAGRVSSVFVFLADVNGPRGGVDKICQMTAVVQGVGPIPVNGSGLTTGGAITGTARRLKYRISKALRQMQKPANESIRVTGIEAA